VAVLAYLVCAVVWGTTWFVIRVCIGPDGYPPYAAAALRFTIAAVLLGAVWAVGIARPGPRTRRELWWTLAAGTFNAVGYALIYQAEQHIPGGVAALVFGTFPLAVAAIAVATRTERVRAPAVVGAMISVAGIAVLFWDRLAVSPDQALAVGLVAIAVLASASYSVILKRVTRDQHPLAATGAFCGVTAVLLWGGAVVGDTQPIPWPPPARPTIALLYLGVVGSALVFAAYMALLKRARLMAVSTLVFLQPIIALAADALWETQVRVVARTYVGGAIVLAGVAVNVFLGRPREAPPASSAAPAAPRLGGSRAGSM
jgi:drug/metabolite transporter (DMT)-like permease